MNEVERIIIDKLSGVMPSQDFCYLNKIFRVQFKLSDQYIIDSDWDRHHKAISIFDKIIKLV